MPSVRSSSTASLGNPEGGVQCYPGAGTALILTSIVQAMTLKRITNTNNLLPMSRQHIASAVAVALATMFLAACSSEPTSTSEPPFIFKRVELQITDVPVQIEQRTVQSGTLTLDTTTFALQWAPQCPSPTVSTSTADRSYGDTLSYLNRTTSSQGDSARIVVQCTIDQQNHRFRSLMFRQAAFSDVKTAAGQSHSRDTTGISATDVPYSTLSDGSYAATIPMDSIGTGTILFARHSTVTAQSGTRTDDTRLLRVLTPTATSSIVLTLRR